jgi:Ca-activated chloride channel homolog
MTSTNVSAKPYRKGWRATQLFLAVSTLGVLSSCTVPSQTTSSTRAGTDQAEVAIDGDAIGVDVAASSEKITVLTELAETFNNDSKLATVKDASGASRSIQVRVKSKASGGAATALVNGWAETDGPQPVLWSPSARSWGAIVNQRLADKGAGAMVDMAAPSFMLTPLVIAMPKPMASALGYPATPVGFSDLIALAKDPAGWGTKGHPEWGTFKLGKTNPNFSTSGLSATIAMYYAATGKTTALTLEDLNKPEVQQYATDVESSVVHYGDITMTFLNNWFRSDARGTSLTYASAVAVEEKSVIDYNSGNPDGVLDTGEVPRKPRVPLVAVYPKEGTLLSDNPLFILDAPWVTPEQKTAAKAFQDFLQKPENQKKVLEFGFRPGNPSVAIGAPIITANGVDPNEPKTALDVPEPKVLTKSLDLWANQRKKARVLLVVDVSGSMGDPAVDGGNDTKLDLAKRAAISALDEFNDEDQVGLRIFTTNVDGKGNDFVDIVPIEAMGTNRELMARKIDDLQPLEGTPLYTVAQASLDLLKESLDPTRINAIVLLTDGQNADGNDRDDQDQLDALIASSRKGSEGKSVASVRIFPIAYGAGADLGILKRIAEATTATAYDASDPNTIEKVFTNVVSNF